VERQLTPAEASFVSEARVGHLGTQQMGRWPHVVPVCHVLDLDRIVIASAYDQKIENIRENASVTYCVDRYSEDWDNGLAQVVVSGEAYLIDGGHEFGRDRALLYEKFPQYERVAPIEEDNTVIIEFRVQQVHSSGVNGAG
jgi:nitroimidazol reductase NimA-like FMN-containing flavoprotein (pyridoxamine 5'-phosphate oxidase superfamily)